MPNNSVQITSPTHFVKSNTTADSAQSFDLNQKQFGHLASSEEFQSMQSNLIEIDISNQMQVLNEEGYIEVTVPVMGITDFMPGGSETYQLAQQFAAPIAINQFGAPTSETPHFAKADFIMVKDLIGNEFELFVNADGTIDIPEQGTGRFSIITEITYIFSTDQVLSGRGFDSLAGAGAKESVLYLLPPNGHDLAFEIQVAATHLNELNQKVVDQALQIPIVQINQDVPAEQLAVNVTPLATSPHEYQVEIEYLKKKNTHQPFMLNLSLNEPEVGDYQLREATSAWQVNDAQAHIFSKQVGISEFAMTALTRNLFTEFDFTSALLKGETFGLLETAGFNDFSLSPEAIGYYYDRMVTGLVNHTVQAETWLKNIPPSHFEQLALDEALFEYQDQMALETIQADLAAGKLETLTDLFNISVQTPATVKESFVLQVNNAPEHHVPEARLLIDTGSQHASQSLIETLNDSISTLEQYALDSTQSEISLSPGHDAITIHFDDIVHNVGTTGALIKGFDVNHDKINLSSLIEGQFGVSKESVRAEVNGQDIHIKATDTTTGQELVVATLVNATPSDPNTDLSGLGSMIEFSI